MRLSEVAGIDNTNRCANNSHRTYVLNGASCPKSRKRVLCTRIVVEICRARPPEKGDPLAGIAMRLLNEQPFLCRTACEVPGSCSPAWGQKGRATEQDWSY